MTITPERPGRPPEPELVDAREDLVALARALRHASEQLSHVRASAFGATTSATIAGPASTDAVELLESLDAEAGRLRALLERRPLEHGCDPVHDDVVVTPELAPRTLAVALQPAHRPAGPADRQAARRGELLTRLDALDAESDEVLEALSAVDGHVGGVAPADAPAPAARTFLEGMHGGDVRAWQRYVNRRLRAWRIAYQIGVDGDYGPETSLWSRRVLYGLGLSIAGWDGVTPQARIKARHPQSRGAAELARARERRTWLRRLRRRYDAVAVHTPVEGIITSSHGYSAGHDGIDLICPADARIFAVCRARVIDVRSGGWWGKSPTGDVSLDDGIIQLEALTSIGPLRQGMHIGYGHAERARVSVGQTVEAGDELGRAGLANAWHIHFMVNDGSTMRGIGNIDPRPCLNLFTSRTSRTRA
jgi:hypothetical protein